MTIKVPALAGFRDQHGVLAALFADGIVVHLHSSRDRRRFYALQAHDPHDPTIRLSRCEDHSRRLAAMKAFFQGARVDIWTDRDGDLTAEVRP